MMEFVVAIDNLALLFFTKISHKFYRLTSRTNFFLAKISIYITIASLMTTILGFWLPILRFKPSPIFVVLAALVSLGLLLCLNLCDKADDAIFSDNRVKFFAYSPSFRVLGIVYTITVIIPAAINGLYFSSDNGVFVFKALYYIGMPALVSYFYFASVDPPVPGKSKIREWVEAFSAGFQKLVPIKAQN